MKIGSHQHFVMADIPGLIEGAADGAGLGLRFLKHLTRTRLLLHVVDIAPFDESDPAYAVEAILKELKNFSAALTELPRWLVINKVDLLAEEDRDALVKDLVERLGWEGELFVISAASGIGTQDLVQAAHRWLGEHRLHLAEDPDAAEAHAALLARMENESLERVEERLTRRKRKKDDEVEDDDDFNEDDYDVEVEYAP